MKNTKKQVKNIKVRKSVEIQYEFEEWEFPLAFTIDDGTTILVDLENDLTIEELNLSSRVDVFVVVVLGHDHSIKDYESSILGQTTYRDWVDFERLYHLEDSNYSEYIFSHNEYRQRDADMVKDQISNSISKGVIDWLYANKIGI